MKQDVFRKEFSNQFSDMIANVKYALKVIYCYQNGIGKYTYYDYFKCLHFQQYWGDLEYYCVTFLNNDYSRKKRLKNRIIDIISQNDDPRFLTFDFSDEYLNKTTPLDRRHDIANFLKKNCSNYVANVDYGSRNEYTDRHGTVRVGTGREHYHAVVSNKVDFSSDLFNVYSLPIVKADYSSEEKLSKYIAKLNAHGVKKSVDHNRCIYARVKK